MEALPPRIVPSSTEGGRNGSGLAMASLILGIVGVLTSVVVVGAFLGVVGLTLGAIHLTLRKQGAGRKIARWGVGLSTLSVAASLGFVALYLGRMQQAVEFFPQGGQGSLQAWVGREAPDLDLTAIDGSRWRLSELRGRRVILDFWATWCPPCVQEIPHFTELRRSLPTNEVVLLGISAEDRAVLRPFVGAHRVNYPIISAGPSELPEPFDSISALPTTVFLDAEGRIRQVLVGGQSLARLRQEALAQGPAGDNAVAR